MIPRLFPRSLLLLAGLGTACLSAQPLDVGKVDDTRDTGPQVDTGPIDTDGDGWNQNADCDDTDNEVFPGAIEVCNGIDDNCNGQVDEELLSTWYADEDGDGYGDPDSAQSVCERPPGYIETSGDCDDTDDQIHPDAEDLCDGIDSNCDGTPDSDAIDSDGDGTCNGLDSSVYANDFDDGSWEGWTTVELATGPTPSSWEMSDGTLHEVSDVANSLAVGPDLGELENYTIGVDLYFNPSLNNGGGIAFAYEDERNFWMARWLDPNDSYGYYPLGGHMEIYRCVSAICEVEAFDDGSTSLAVPEEIWAELQVQVQGDKVSVSLEGSEVLTYTESGASPIGPHHFGLWSYDNDGGVFYNNLVVTNP